jgi:hypothetical protein
MASATLLPKAKSLTSCTGNLLSTIVLKMLFQYIPPHALIGCLLCLSCNVSPNRNIKHAFYQPAENEMITLVHFHLTHPIMVRRSQCVRRR